MKIALLRVGIDSGCGGMQGPLFADGTFDYVPIPDGRQVSDQTYGNTRGRSGRFLADYFPEARQAKMRDQPIHLDPEFETFTYGDPTGPKTRLRCLEPGDLLVFYCGLQGWGFDSPPALYLLGYFEVEIANRARDMAEETLSLFCRNFHVRHKDVFEAQKSDLVLVKGTDNSRLFKKAICINEMGEDASGKPIKVLSKGMKKVFGDFDGHTCIQRSPPRWVASEYIAKAECFIKSLE